MNNSRLVTLFFATVFLCTLPRVQAADVTFNPNESVGRPNSNGQADFTGFGSAGYLLSAVAPVSSGPPSGVNYTGVNPLMFSASQPVAGDPSPGMTTFATSNHLDPSLFTATNLGGNFVKAGGFAYGVEPAGTFDYIGLGGSQNGTSAVSPATAVDEYKLTFNQSSAAGYRIAVSTQSNGNGNGFNGITLYSGGTSLATSTSSSTNNETLAGVVVFYSFDITNITAGDSVTVDLFSPQGSGDLMSYGFTLDALPAVPEPRTLLAGGGFFLLALAMVRNRIREILPVGAAGN